MDRYSTMSPLGSLLDEMREARVNHVAPEPTPASPAPPRPPRTGPRPEPDLRLEAGVVSGARGGTPAPSWRWIPSLVLHGLLFIGVVALPVVLSDDLPAPASAAKAFFLLPAVAPPPTPLAAPASRKMPAAEPRKFPARPRPEPSAVPASEAAAAAPAAGGTTTQEPDLAILGDGLPEGVAGGVPGGVVGGLVQPEPEPEVRPRPRVRAGIDVKEPRKVKNVAPAYPEVAARGKIEGVVLLEVTIRPDGRVGEISVLRGIPLLDAAAVAAARQWVFAPTLLDGVPVSVTMTVPVRFSLTDGPVRASF
jgi:protein TonB